MSQLSARRLAVLALLIVAATLGPRVEEPGASLVPGFAYSAPFEDLRLKK